MKFSDLLRFVLGVVLGMALLLTGTIAAARYLIDRFTAPPPKPIFAEELPSPSPQPVPSVASDLASSTPTPAPSAPSPSPSPRPSPSPSPNKTTPPGPKAIVNWPQGLAVRSDPSVSAASVGGVDYNTEVVVLETSADGNWQRIWANGTEGWIKAGNVTLTGTTSPGGGATDNAPTNPDNPTPGEDSPSDIIIPGTPD